MLLAGFDYGLNPDDISNIDRKIFGQSILVSGQQIFGVILGASSTIFAISFTISQFMVQRMSTTYSPFILQEYNKWNWPKFGFYAFIVVIIISASALIITNQGLEAKYHYFLIKWTIGGFIGSIVLFTYIFFVMMRFINPLEFASKIGNIAMRHFKNDDYGHENLIDIIGDIAISAIQRNESSISLSYVNELERLSNYFIDKKIEKGSSSYNNDPRLSEDRDVKALSQILSKLKDIYTVAYKTGHTNVTLKIIETVNQILKRTLDGKNDDLIKLFVSQRKHGVFLHELQTITSSIKEKKDEKSALIEYLNYLPSRIIYSDVDLSYADYLLPHHLFDMVKIIVDEDDFESFRYFVKDSLQMPYYSDPGDITSSITMDLMMDGAYNRDIRFITEPLRFFTRIECAKNYSKIHELETNLGAYHDLLKIHSIQPVYSKVKDEKELKKMIRELYVRSLMYQAFFWIGAYLISKGHQYARYMDFLWNITKSKDDKVIILNEPPIPKDLTWATLLVLYGNNDVTFETEFYERQEVTQFLYKYLGMIMLKSEEDFAFPTEEQIKFLIELKKDDILSKWMAVCSGIQSESFVKSLSDLEKYVDLEKYFEFENPQQVINGKVKRLQDEAVRCGKMIERLRSMSDTITQHIVGLIAIAYEKHAIINSLANVTLEESRIPLLKRYTRTHTMEKRAFQEIEGVSTYWKILTDSIAQNMVDLELSIILEKLRGNRNIKKHKLKADELVSKLERIFIEMKTQGAEPDVIFIPRLLIFEFNKGSGMPMTNVISINGKALVTLMPRTLKDDEIHLFSKSSLQVRFLKTKHGWLDLAISENLGDANKTNIVSSFDIGVDITNTKGIRHIRILDIKKL